ncbi:MAG: PKD domain-containing protein [Thermoplasmata archaeon]|nr:MAG: PKD domain-containing protein [Thermoplasmata archaeon]
MYKKSTRKALSIIMMLAIVLSAMPALTGSANDSDLVELEGVVMTEDNRPVPYATVYIINAHTGAQVERGTDDKGYFHFTVDEGSYVLNAEASGYLNFQGIGTSDVIIMEAGDISPSPVVLKLRKVPLTAAEEITINGTIMDSMGKGISSATIEFLSTGNLYRNYTTSTTSLSGNLSINGTYEIELFKDDFTITIKAEDFRTAVIQRTFSADATEDITLNAKPNELFDSVSGYIRDKDTGKYITDGMAYLYDKSKQNFISSGTPGIHFEISAYSPGQFMLIVDAPGYKPHYEYLVELPTLDSDEFWAQDIYLEPVGEDEIATTIDFGSDWNTTTIDSVWTLNADSKVFGLHYTEFGDLRFHIDFEDMFWNGDRKDSNGNDVLEVNSDELTAFNNYLKNRGPYHISTSDFIQINESNYIAKKKSGGAFDFSVSTSNINREYGDDSVMKITTHTDYKLEEGVTGNSQTLDIGKLREHEHLTIKVPIDFEIADWTPSDADVELTNFHEAEVRSSDVVLTINRVEGPKADIYASDNYVKPLVEIEFNASGSTDVSGRGIQNYTWKLKDGAVLGYGMGIFHNFSKPGEYNVTLAVIDSSDLTDTDYEIIKVDNTPPTPAFKLQDNESVELKKEGGQYVVDENKLVFFNGTMSTDTLDGTIPSELDMTSTDTFIWNFGDGMELESGPEVNHVYTFYSSEAHEGDNTYVVELNVTDKAGNYALINTTILIKDKTEPIPIITPPPAIDIGEEVTWNASGTTDNFYDPDTLKYVWDFDDGTTGVIGKVVNHVYQKPGVYNAKVNVSDGNDNWKVTESSALTVRGVNLAVNRIYFQKETVEDGDEITIQVNITNTQFGQYSGADAYDIIVTLFDGQKQIGQPQNVDHLALEEFKIVNFTWKAKGAGTHEIMANVTLINTTWELSWDDNNLTRKIVVEEEESNAAFTVTVILIIVVIIIFVVIFLRRRGLITIGRGRRGKDKSKKEKGKKDKGKGKKKK